MFPKSDSNICLKRESSVSASRKLPPRPPMFKNKIPFLPKINKNANNVSHNISNDSSFNKRSDDSFSLKRSNDSNNVSYISTNSNSSIQNIKKNENSVGKIKMNGKKTNSVSRPTSVSSTRSLCVKTKPPKDITSKSWVIYNVNTNQIIYGKKHHQQREIASLTKIMTCYVSLLLAKKLNLNMNEMTVKITKLSASMTGTSANLKEDDQLKMIDLIYGLMLPSGNDAAYALGEAFGCLLFYDANNKIKLYEILQNKYICVKNELVNVSNDPLKYFLNEMNKTAMDLKLYNTFFVNPHGLMNRHNKSTAADCAKLACVTLKHPAFFQIVNTKQYESIIKNMKSASTRKELWFNTNKLLDKGFIGLKTGITNTAGPCLSTSLKFKQKDKEVWAVCVILSCRTMEKRWGECEELLHWGIKEILNKNDEKFL